MIAVRKLTNQLSFKQQQAVRAMLVGDETYAEITVQIFDAYVCGKTIDSIFSSFSLDEKSFRVFERIIYRAVLQFYKLDDQSVKELLFTSIFYAINGVNDQNKQSRIKSLEENFYNLKRYGFEEEALPLLEELYSLSKGSQLETVYLHLYKKYERINYLNQLGIATFEKLNYLLEQFLTQGQSTSTKPMIEEYKKLRNLCEQEEQSKTLKSLFNLSKLSLVVVADQEQLLLEGSYQLNDLLQECEVDIIQLAFGFKKFYLRNILNILKCKSALKAGKIAEAKEVYKQANLKGFYEAYNFNYPKLISSQVKEELKKGKLFKLADLPNKGKLVKWKDIIQYAFVPEDYGRNRISHLMN